MRQARGRRGLTYEARSHDWAGRIERAAHRGGLDGRLGGVGEVVVLLWFEGRYRLSDCYLGRYSRCGRSIAPGRDGVSAVLSVERSGRRVFIYLQRSDECIVGFVYLEVARSSVYSLR